MMCFSPLSIQNPNSTNPRNRLSVPCGKCYACRMNYRISWTFRLAKEMLGSTSCYFLTLTYDENAIPEKIDKKTGEIHQVLRKSDLQSFIKRARYYDKNIRYFAVGEYGEETLRPHYHILIFNLDSKNIDKVLESWKDGIITISDANAARIHYITKDMMKSSGEKHASNVDSFRIMSTRPAIGKNWLKHAKNNKLAKEFTVWHNGYRIAMPRYYSDKIFNIREKEERQKLMEVESIKQFDDFMRLCERKGIKKPFKQLVKHHIGLLRQEKKLKTLRKL